MRRGVVLAWLVLGVSVAVLVGLVLYVSGARAQEKAAPKPITATETAQWRAYAEQLETDLQSKARGVAQCTATVQALRVEIDRLQKLVAETPKP